MGIERIESIVNVEAIKSEFEALNKEIDNSMKNLGLYAKETAELNKQIQQAKGIKELSGSMEKLTEQEAKLTAAQEELNKSNERLQKNQEKLNQATNELIKADIQYEKQMRANADRLKELSIELERQRARSQAVTAANKILKQQYESGTHSLEDYTKKLAANNQIGQEAKLAVSELTREQKALIKEMEAVPGTMVQISLTLERMRKEYKLLTDEERRSPYGVQMQSQIESLDVAIKGLDETVGLNQRKVGAYTESVMVGFSNVGRTSSSLMLALDRMGVSNNNLRRTLTPLTFATRSLTQTMRWLERDNIKARIATSGFGRALKALPLGWVLAGVAALVTGIVLLVKWMTQKDKLLNSIKEKYEETSQEAAKLIVEVQKYQKVISDTTKTEIERMDAMEKYNQAAKEQNLFTIDANKTIGEQNDLMQLNISLIKERAKVQAIEAVQQELMEELIREEIKLENVKIGVKDKNDKYLNLYIGKQQKIIKGLEEEINRAGELAEKYNEISKTQEIIALSQRKRQQAEQKRIEQQEEINKQLNEQRKIDEENAKAWQDKINKAQEYYQKIQEGRLSGTALMLHEYEKDKIEYQRLLNSKLWTHEQYTWALAQRYAKYVSERNAYELEMQKIHQKAMESLQAQSATIVEDYTPQLDALIKFQNNKIKLEKETFQSIMTDESLSFKERKLLLEAFYKDGLISAESFKNGILTLNEQITQSFEKFSQMGMQIFGNLAQISDNKTQKILHNTEKETQAAINALDEQLMGAEAYTAARARLEEQLEQKRKVAAIEDAQRQKRFGIFQIAIDTALAIMKIWAGLGTPIEKIGYTALVSALGGIQAAAVASAPLPAYARGREGGDAEFAWTGEEGREAIIHDGKTYLTPNTKTLTFLPENAKVIPAPETKQMIKDGMDILMLKSLNANLEKLISVSSGNEVLQIDENGFMKIIKRGNSTTKYLRGLKS